MSLVDAAGWDAMCPDPEEKEKKPHHKRVPDKKLALAMLAGARAIETNRRCDCATYVRDPFGENDGPLELAYYDAAKILRKEGKRILEVVKED